MPQPLRSSPSGRNLATPIIQALGYTVQAPLALTLKAAGHTPGLYLIGQDVYIRVIDGGAQMSRSLSFSAPNGVGAVVTLAVNISITSLGRSNAAGTGFICIRSNGLSPIVANYAGVGVTVIPSIDIYTSAQLIGV